MRVLTKPREDPKPKSVSPSIQERMLKWRRTLNEFARFREIVAVILEDQDYEGYKDYLEMIGHPQREGSPLMFKGYPVYKKGDIT